MNSKIFILILIVLSAFILSAPVQAFEDGFQYYPLGITSATTWTWGPLTSIVTSGATYNRLAQIYYTTGAPGSGEGYFITPYLNTNYIAFNIKSVYTGSTGGCLGSGGSGSCHNQIYVYDGSMNQIATYVIPTNQIGLYEIIKNGNNENLRVNGVDLGDITTLLSSNNIGYIKFYSVAWNNWGSGSAYGMFQVDDISTSGYISQIGTESTTHTLTESNLAPMNISCTINTFPWATYTTDNITQSIMKYNGGAAPIAIASKNVKNSGNTTIFFGNQNYNRKTELTSNDTNYGLYFSYLKKNGAVVASDYFFLVPPGTVNTVTTADVSAVIGQSEAISYSIGTPDFAGSSYAINVYSLSALVDSLPIATGAATGTVYWETTDNSAGIYFVTLSKTTSGLQTDLAYTTITLVSTLFIRGNVYDAVNGTGLTGVTINYKQGTTWFNTTSNGNGSYNLSGLTVALLTSINASKSGWIHDNFSFTPLAPQIYTINLYMIPTSFNCSVAAGGINVSNTCINGMTLNNPYRQAVPGATVNIGNVNYSNTTTSSAITGYYQFLNLTDDSVSVYVVNATKTGFQNSPDYNVTTLNQTDKQQIILMSEIYALTIQAQDATNANTLLDFNLLFNLANYNTTIGQITIPNLIYGQYPAIVSATDYVSSSQTILVDSTKTVTFILSPITQPPTSTIFKTLPHDVSFVVQDIMFNKKPGVSVTAQGFNTTVGTWSQLGSLIGIDFNTTPINNEVMSGITSTDGSIDFKMDGSIYYVITFYNGGISNITWSGYPTQYQYLIIVPTVFTGTFTNNTNQFATLSTTVSTSSVNATSAKIFANYSDSSNQTILATIYLNQSIQGDPNNQTNLQTISGGSTNGTLNATFAISPYAGNSYIISFYIQHTSLGTVYRSYGISFPPTSPLINFNPTSILMLLVGLVLFFAGFWGQTSTEQGSGIIVGLVWLLSGIGITTGLNLGLNFFLGLTLATVIAILMNINARSRREGIS